MAKNVRDKKEILVKSTFVTMTMRNRGRAKAKKAAKASRSRPDG